MSQKTTSRKRKVLRLRQLRRAREMTQETLGRRVGLDKVSISMIESGARKPSLDKALLLAAEFGESIEALFSYVEIAS
jgi:DNA-binding XRE family transcriptional regulator